MDPDPGGPKTCGAGGSGSGSATLLFGDALFEGWEPVPGTTTPGSVPYWMCTEYRLSVTPEKILVQDKDNRGHFLQQWAMGA